MRSRVFTIGRDLKSCYRLYSYNFGALYDFKYQILSRMCLRDFGFFNYQMRIIVNKMCL